LAFVLHRLRLLRAAALARCASALRVRNAHRRGAARSARRGSAKIREGMTKIVLHKSWESVQIQTMSTAQRSYDRGSTARRQRDESAQRDVEAITRRDAVRFCFR
jgi:hypothetical protein